MIIPMNYKFVNTIIIIIAFFIIFYFQSIIINVIFCFWRYSFGKIIHQKNQTIYANKYNYKYKNVIYQPILDYIFYYNGSGFENNVVLWDKLMKKKLH